jgi:hypothetical protein
MINSLSISDLIAELEELAETLGEDTPVMASCDYGDHCHTEQLINIESVTFVVPGKTAYSESGLCYPSEDDLENQPEEEQKVIVLRYV